MKPLWKVEKKVTNSYTVNHNTYFLIDFKYTSFFWATKGHHKILIIKIRIENYMYLDMKFVLYTNCIFRYVSF
jgi:hypothetical protein